MGNTPWGPTVPQHSQVLGAREEEQRLYLTPQGKRKSERFNNFPKITQLAAVGARVQKQTV